MKHPDWFPHEIEFVNSAYMGFYLNRDGTHAMVAIRAIIAADLPLPNELMPYLEEACQAWENMKSNKSQVSKSRTYNKWRGLVSEAHLHRLLGDKPFQEVLRDVAGKIAGNKHDLERKAKTLDRYYRGNYEQQKDNIGIIVERVQQKWPKMSNDDVLKLVKEMLTSPL